MVTLILVLAIVVGLAVGGYVAYSLGRLAPNGTLSETIGRLTTELDTATSVIKITENALAEVVSEKDEVAATLKKTVSQKKSSEVRTGLIAEQSLAFIQDLPYDFKCMRFMGAPVDYFYFDVSDPEAPEVVIVEVKSGKAVESKTQRLLRKAIVMGNVSYHLVRIGPDGVVVKRYPNVSHL